MGVPNSNVRPAFCMVEYWRQVNETFFERPYASKTWRGKKLKKGVLELEDRMGAASFREVNGGTLRVFKRKGVCILTLCF